MTTQGFRVRAGRASAFAGAVLAIGSFAFAGAASAGSSVTPGASINSPNSVDATTWSTTADCAAEWHWVITGLTGSNIDSTDVPSSVHVTWSDDSTSDIAFEKITGGTVHYLDVAVNIPVTRTVKSATAVWPTPTDVTSFNSFNLSHGPCVAEETTTTVEETTTTVEETTTTVEETTTTVEETTTSVESEVPTTVAEGTTTTEAVESQSPGGELPATGSDMSTQMLVGGLVLMAGGVLASALGRRSRPI